MTQKFEVVVLNFYKCVSFLLNSFFINMLHSNHSLIWAKSRKLSSEKKGVTEIAEMIGCSGQSVRQAIKAFDKKEVKGLEQQSNRPKSAKKVIEGKDLERLKELINESPRKYGKKQSIWTLPMLAEVSYEKGITPKLMSSESIRLAIKRLEINWNRAKEWITSPEPRYERKKKARQNNRESKRKSELGSRIYR